MLVPSQGIFMQVQGVQAVRKAWKEPRKDPGKV